MNSKLLIILGLFLTLHTSYAQNKLLDTDHGQQIFDYLEENKEKNNLLSDDLLDIYVKSEYVSEKTEITHVYLVQRYQSVEIFNTESSITVKDNKVFYHADRFVPNISQKIKAINPLLGPEDAIGKASAHFGLPSPTDLELIEPSIDNNFLFNPGSVSQENIPVKLVYRLKDGELKLSWNLSILTLDGKHWWSVRVDAVTGEIIDVNDWILNCKFGGVNHSDYVIEKALDQQKNAFVGMFGSNKSFLTDGSQYNVFAIPDESPNHGARQLVSEPANLDASPYGWHDVDGAAGAEYTITRGNNVHAQMDEDGNDGTGFAPDGTAGLNFDFTLDVNDYPINNQEASITNLFYLNNVMHDIWYQYGFTEAAGNFQEHNYGKSGTGEGDSVNADGQDGSGLNNAVFGTPPDGENPRMQMYLWLAFRNALTINGGPLAGYYIGLESTFGGALSQTPITTDLVLVEDNNLFGTSTDPNDACDGIINGPSISGKIAVIRRGDCEFGFKVRNAETQGAIAVIMVNNVAGNPIVMGPGDDGEFVTIPSIMVGQTDGEAIITALDNGDTVNASIYEPIKIDGNYDNGVIAHEYGHGISNRLTGGPLNVDCLGNNEQMGEGWSDWFGLMITMKSSDLATDGRGIGTYDSDQDIDGPGIRPARYSTDFAINDFTYADTNDTANVSVPHGVGFVWCTMLWDLTWAYIDKYGFDTDFYSGSGGNNKVMQLVMDGLKLQACEPGFIDGRNALLMADMALTGGENQCLIWEVFSARGLGIAADQGLNSSRTDQLEDFTVPEESDVISAGLPTLAACTTLSSNEFTASDYQLYPNPAKDKLILKTGKNLGDAILTLSDINGRTVISQKATLLGEVELNISNLASGMYILNIKGEYLNSNEKIIKD